jgi:hypothetical protein
MAARLKRRSPDGARAVLGADTEIVIEAFPRSASSFALRAFEFAQSEKPVRIATHLHSFAHAVEGVRRGLPVLIITRRPQDAVVGYRVWAWQLYKQRGRLDRKSAYEVPIGDVMKDYVRFHEGLIPYSGQYVLATFEEVTEDFGQVIDRLNAHYDAHFLPFEHTQENERAIFKAGGVHLSPSPERDAKKTQFIAEYRSRELAPLAERANDAYEKIKRLNPPLREESAGARQRRAPLLGEKRLEQR